MSARLPCPPAPGPLEEFAVQFDPLFRMLAQWHGLTNYRQILAMPSLIQPFTTISIVFVTVSQ